MNFNKCCHHVLVKGSQRPLVFFPGGILSAHVLCFQITTQSLVEASPHFHPRAMTQEEGLVEVDSIHME